MPTGSKLTDGLAALFGRPAAAPEEEPALAVSLVDDCSRPEEIACAGNEKFIEVLRGMGYDEPDEQEMVESWLLDVAKRIEQRRAAAAGRPWLRVRLDAAGGLQSEWDERFMEEIGEAGYAGEDAADNAARWLIDAARALEKQRADDAEQPWVRNSVIEFDKDEFGLPDPRHGNFGYEWNEAFIEFLVINGYKAETEEEIVDQWMVDVARDISFEAAQRDKAVQEAPAEPGMDRRLRGWKEIDIGQ